MTEFNYTSNAVDLQLGWNGSKFTVNYGTYPVGDFMLCITNATDAVTFNFHVSPSSGIEGVPTALMVPLNDDAKTTVTMKHGDSEQTLDLYVRKFVVTTTSPITLDLQRVGAVINVTLPAGGDLGVLPRIWARLNASDVFTLNLNFPVGSTLRWQVADGTIHSSTAGSQAIYLPTDGVDKYITLTLIDSGGAATKKLKLNVNSTTTMPKPDWHGPPKPLAKKRRAPTS